MFLNLKNWQTIALVSLAIIGPWLIGLAWGLQSAVLSALFASFLFAILIGIAALISPRFGPVQVNRAGTRRRRGTGHEGTLPEVARVVE